MPSYLSFFEYLFWIYSIANVLFCVWLAGQKYRSMLAWAVLSVAFGFLATAFLMAAPVIPETERNIEPTSIKDFGKTPKDNEADELRNDPHI